MIELTTQIAAAVGYPAFSVDTDGLIRYANDAARELWPACEMEPLPDLLPDFFMAGEYRPDFRFFQSHHNFYNVSGQKLEVIRFDDRFFCRILPAPQLEPMEESGAEDELEQIRRSVLSIVRQGSSIEDFLNDNDSVNTGLFTPVVDKIFSNDINCRRIILSCNRLEAASISPDRYPPQTVDLTDSLSRLVHEICTDLPGLKAPVRAQLPEHPVVIKANWPLLRRVILEAVRCSEGAAEEQEGSMVFGISLSVEGDNALITLSDNYSGLPDPENPRRGPDAPYTSWVYIRRLVEMMDGNLKAAETPYGDRALEIRFPLDLEGLPRSGKVLTFQSGSGYRVNDRMVLSDPLIYLEKFSR